MGVPNSDLQDLERQRLQLEGNIRKLEQSLYHWRTWEAEYDGLVEEISVLNDGATTDELLDAGVELAGSLVTEDEVKTIVGVKEGTPRTKQQVVDIVTRRIDYVKQNVATMEKRLRAEENKLQKLNDLEQMPTEPAADYPMTEIVEELDEEGNVISSSTATPGNEASELLDILKKAGVKDIPNTEKETRAETPRSIEQSDSPAQVATGERSPPNQDGAPGEVREPREVPVTDVDESPEDAQLRREMIRYGLDEVGAVVAELELDEEASDVSFDDYDDVYDYDDEEEEEDEFGRSRTVLNEDYHQQMRELEAKLNARGMWNMGKDTTELPEEVKRELEQPAVVRVEKSTESTDAATKKPKPKKKVAFADDLDIAPPPKPSAAEKKVAPLRQSDIPVVSDAVVERSEPTEPTTSANNAPKKTSRFKAARAPDTNASIPVSTMPSDDKPRPAELRSALRKPTTSPSPSSLPLFPAKPKEPKPFSQPISDVSDTQPTSRGPKGKILADTLVEHEISESAAAPPEPDELDEQLHRKEIASEFYNMRNRVIQQNGGFLQEPEQVPVETEEAPRRNGYPESTLVLKGYSLL
ncbi:Prefoldin subunit-domain-containing protein [Aspergillus ambiguus]|uniref:prefoldin-like protein n=1 Tax=Aspergillus ambiguus TaxID=176160 RepID=UPI003CCE0D6E